MTVRGEGSTRSEREVPKLAHQHVQDL